MQPHSMPSPAWSSAVNPRRTRWLSTAAAPALALLVAAGLTGCALWPGPVGGGATVDLRVGDADEAVSAEDMDQVVEVLRQRIAAMGAGRADIAPGDGAVTVELPRDMDPGEAIDLMERPGLVAIHRVVDGVEGTVEAPTGVEATLPDPDSSVQLQLGPVRLGNDEIESAEPEWDTSGSQWEVHLGFTDEGAESWNKVSGEAACFQQGVHRRRIAIVVDGEVVSAPEVPLDVACEVDPDDATAVVTGVFTEEEALALAALVSTDPLPVEVTAES